jgi:ATP-dependent DNA ligase
MLAKLSDHIPTGSGWLFEPKWDGFRAIVFRDGDQVYIQSRDLKPFDRYFPELHEGLHAHLPPGCVLDGEIVVMRADGLDFDALQMRIHPAASRVAKLASETPASFIAFDALAADGTDLMEESQAVRRERLERLLVGVEPPVWLTPVTRDRTKAEAWLDSFEGAGLDGVIAKDERAAHQPGKRVMLKIKHARTADCVVGGFRWYKNHPDVVGSLLLGLFDDAGTLQHVGITSSFKMAERRRLVTELAPLRVGAHDGHPWTDGASEGDRIPGGPSRWSGGKDLSWVPLRPERVCEVKYDHMQSGRFRHATTFLRWRSDKPPEACRYDQLEVVKPYDLGAILAGGDGA